MPSLAPALPRQLNGLLKSVSRSFYLTLRVLPRPIRPQIGLAYLLARTSDTIADTPLIAPEERIEALTRYQAAILHGEAAGAGDLVARSPAPTQEGLLLQRVPEMLASLRSLPPGDRHLIQQVLKTITQTQTLDLQHFDREAGGIRALKDQRQFEDYTYGVAGCVGEFWTAICGAHLFTPGEADLQRLRDQGIRFGQGLQTVNILRDLPEDLQIGRCYLPQTVLKDAGLGPDDLTDPANESRFRPVYEQFLSRAEADLKEGWQYTLGLPPRHRRLRLASAWPILFGLATLRKLRAEPPIHRSGRIKIGRSQVYRMILTSILRLPFAGPWERQWDRHAPRE